MRLVPDKQDERIEFFQTKLAVWQAHAAELGLNETELADLAAAVEYAKAHHGEAPMSGAIYGGVPGGMTPEVESFIETVMADMMDHHQSIPDRE